MSIVTEEPGRPSGLLLPLRTSANFRALWIGQSLANVGNAILYVITPILVLSMQGSTMALSLLMTLFMLPQVILLPFAGLLSDRLPRVPVMIGTDVVRFLLLVGIATLAALHRMTLADLDGFAVLFGAMQALFQPTYAAVRAEVFTPDIRNAANSLTKGTQQLSSLAGPALGGVLAGFASGAVGLGVNAVGFLISVISLLYVRLPRRVAGAGGESRQVTGLRDFGRDLLGGFIELRKHTWLWLTILVFAFMNISFSGINAVLLPWLIKVHLRLPSYDFGFASAASAVGAVVASIVYGRRSRWQHRGLLGYLGFALTGVALGGLAWVQWMPVICLLTALAGAGMMLFGLVWEVSLQELVPTEAYGRVASLDMFGSFSLMPLGFMLTGLMTRQWGGTTAIAVESAFIVVCTLAALMVPAIRKFQ